MIPLRDSTRSASYPVVTKALIFVNVLVFLWELGLGPNLPRAFVNFAIIPARYTHPAAAAQEFGPFANPVVALTPFLSSMFLHGGWMHLLGNMWTLWIFGDNVEDRLGKARYLAFYLGSGLAAGLVHLVTNPNSAVPTLGASGAIAGVMGAYFRFYPHARIEAVIPPLIFGPIFVLPAVVFLGWWFLLQFFSGTLSLASAGSQYGGIAWWAHVGGFAFGVAVGLLMPKSRTQLPPRFIEL